MKYACCLGLLLLLVGCGKFNGDIIDPERCNTVQGIMKYDDLNAQSRIQKKIYCEFESKGKMVFELPNSSKQEITEIEIKDKELEDIEAIFADALKDQCPECLATSKEDADVVIKAAIVRLVGHVENFDASGDESMVFSGGDREERLEYQVALTVDTDINGKISTYDHIIGLNAVIKTHVEKLYAVFYASTTKNRTSEFVTTYDSIPLATGAIIFIEEMDAFPGFNTTDFDKSGYIDVYDLSDMEVEFHLDLSRENNIWWWDDDSNDQVIKNEVIALYSSGVGCMRYLIYDYVKHLLKEVYDAQ